MKPGCVPLSARPVNVTNEEGGDGCWCHISVPVAVEKPMLTMESAASMDWQDPPTPVISVSVQQRPLSAGPEAPVTTPVQVVPVESESAKEPEKVVVVPPKVMEVPKNTVPLAFKTTIPPKPPQPPAPDVFKEIEQRQPNVVSSSPERRGSISPTKLTRGPPRRRNRMEMSQQPQESLYAKQIALKPDTLFGISPNAQPSEGAFFTASRTGTEEDRYGSGLQKLTFNLDEAQAFKSSLKDTLDRRRDHELLNLELQFLEDRHLLESRQRQAEAKKLALQEQCRDDELIEKMESMKTIAQQNLEQKREQVKAIKSQRQEVSQNLQHTKAAANTQAANQIREYSENVKKQRAQKEGLHKTQVEEMVAASSEAQLKHSASIEKSQQMKQLTNVYAALSRRERIVAMHLRKERNAKQSQLKVHRVKERSSVRTESLKQRQNAEQQRKQEESNRQRAIYQEAYEQRKAITESEKAQVRQRIELRKYGQHESMELVPTEPKNLARPFSPPLTPREDDVMLIRRRAQSTA